MKNQAIKISTCKEFCPEQFDLHDISEPIEENGKSIVECVYLGLNAGMKSRINLERDGAGTLRAGDIPTSDAIVRIISSQTHPAGKLCFVQWYPWQLRASVDDSQLIALPSQDALLYASVLGHTGLTAYTSMRLANLRAQDHCIISSAAGGVGVAALQLALASNARVSGIASASRLHVVENLGAAPIDRAQISAGAALENHSVFHDVSGGALLKASIDSIDCGGRIMLCGMLDESTPKNLDRIIHKDIRLQGFSVINHQDWREEFWRSGLRLVDAGKLRPVCAISDKLSSAGEAFCAMFRPDAAPGRHLIRIESGNRFV